jgi:hypothetical protein
MGGADGADVGGPDARDATASMTDGASDGGSSDRAVGAVDADAAVDAAGDAESATDADAAGDSAGMCPDVLGQYGIQTSGSGCGSIFGSKSPCVRAGPSACEIVFESSPAGGSDAGPSAINGQAQLGADGSFTGAALTVGTIQRTGCTGTWDGATSTLTVDCGGVDASQSCVLTLKRYAATCN